ncbi:MAG: hypothetical protein EHM71_07055, partial [Zetaproteobacteria bacterium]
MRRPRADRKPPTRDCGFPGRCSSSNHAQGEARLIHLTGCILHTIRNRQYADPLRPDGPGSHDLRLRGLVTTRTKLYWVAVLYFAEGFPFGIVKDTLPVFFRVHGVRLADIGLLTLVGLPWSLKFLWAPAVDVYGKRRTWILGCQALLILGILALLAVDPSRVTTLLWLLLLSLAFLSATQDIAIDAYTIELLD